MVNYRAMYYRLFNKITDVIEELQVVQQQAEEMYMQDCAEEPEEEEKKAGEA